MKIVLNIILIYSCSLYSQRDTLISNYFKIKHYFYYPNLEDENWSFSAISENGKIFLKKQGDTLIDSLISKYPDKEISISNYYFKNDIIYLLNTSHHKMIDSNYIKIGYTEYFKYNEKTKYFWTLEFDKSKGKDYTNIHLYQFKKNDNYIAKIIDSNKVVRAKWKGNRHNELLSKIQFYDSNGKKELVFKFVNDASLKKIEYYDSTYVEVNDILGLHSFVIKSHTFFKPYFMRDYSYVIKKRKKYKILYRSRIKEF
jgi:hypothetical protein